MNYEKQFVLSLFTRTWVRDSHGLYDYESTQTKNLNAVLADNVTIVRKKHDIKTVTSKEEITDEELLLNVKYEKVDKYILENAVNFSMQPTEKNITDLSNKIWYVLRNEDPNQNAGNQIVNTNEDYYLRKNDIIKLGRVKYALNEIHIQDRMDVPESNDIIDPKGYNINSVNLNSQPVFDFIFLAKTLEMTQEDNQEVLCKICYSDTNEKENPLVHLCQCTGGIRFAHYQCIKKWMETKLNIKENEKKTVKSYNIKSFNCEICKTPYPCKIII